MSRLSTRRGPDDDGSWSSPSGAIHLGFRRLSVMDTSSNGHQPMVSADRGGVLVCNGEIYNFRELRRDLEGTGSRFRSDGDSEVVLELLRRDGVAGLSKLNGMFGLAYVDVEAGTVLLARDQFGIKPLYYATAPGGHGVAFSSRYGALFRTGWLDLDDYDTEALACLMEFDTVPAPHGLHRGTAQVVPGGWVRIGRSGVEASGQWIPADEDPSRLRLDRPLLKDPRAAQESVSAALLESVGRQRLADVPVGLLLSAGIDSPLVGATIRRLTDSPVRSYTIGLPGDDRNEAPGAEAYARSLDFDHRTISLRDADLDDCLTELPMAAHEPISGRVMLQMLALTRAASDQVVVALSGDGGDELFFGYRHTSSLVGNPMMWRVPHQARRVLVGLGRRGIGPARSGAGEAPSIGAYHRSMLGRGSTGLVATLLAGARLPEAVEALFEPTPTLSRRAIADRVRDIELQLHLPFVLRKVDMASMRYGLEVRVPLLDREVARASYAIDPAIHVAGGLGKTILRKELARRTNPAALTNKKLGFGFDSNQHLLGPLRDRVESGLFGSWSCGVDRVALRGMWDRLVAGEPGAGSSANLIWTLLSLQLWDERMRSEVLAARTVPALAR